MKLYLVASFCVSLLASLVALGGLMLTDSLGAAVELAKPARAAALSTTLVQNTTLLTVTASQASLYVGQPLTLTVDTTLNSGDQLVWDFDDGVVTVTEQLTVTHAYTTTRLSELEGVSYTVRVTQTNALSSPTTIVGSGQLSVTIRPYSAFIPVIVSPTIATQLEVVAAAASIPANRDSVVTISATVRDGNAGVVGQTVGFTTTAGRLSTLQATTDSAGIASVQLQGEAKSTLAVVTTQLVRAGLPALTQPVDVRFVPVPCQAPGDEPNNRVGQAKALPSLNGVCQGTLEDDVVKEDDYFRVTLARPGLVMIRLEAIPAGGDYDIQLFASNGTTELAKSINIGNTAEQLSVRVGTAGVYFLRVYQFKRAPTLNTYLLTTLLDP